MKNLYSTPQFLVKGSSAQYNFESSLKLCDKNLTIDWGALTSYFTYGFVTGDRTIFKEIRRTPWMSCYHNNEVKTYNIPAHGLKKLNLESDADKLYKLLKEEVVSATSGYKNVYVLLSGGLDSRIVAGVVSELFVEGKLVDKPIALTWGLSNSRDVYIAKETAKLLDLEWEHLEINHKTVLKNIEISPLRLGLIHSPELLHAFLDVDKIIKENSVVLAGSYGDSIGRGEFMGKHLLNLNINLKTDPFNILNTSVCSLGEKEFKKDIEELLKRSPTDFKWAKDEIFMQAFRMRNGLSHALTSQSINTRTYQLFSSPEIVKMIWDLHPSDRDDRLYEYILSVKLPHLSNLAWARTLKTVRGFKLSDLSNLLPEYHLYTRWSRKELRRDLEELVDLKWFKAKGIFNVESIRILRFIVRNSYSRTGRLNEFWLYLAGFRLLIDDLESKGFSIDFGLHEVSNTKSSHICKWTFVRVYILSKFPLLNQFLKKLRHKKNKNLEKRLKEYHRKFNSLE